ncbi:hypothetical protein BH11VER1_BH11VER1_31090 [soil metagenome]
MKIHPLLLLGSLLFLPPWLPTLSAADRAQTLPVPDFTKGDAIPAGATHDWNLGATGARGWMFCDKMVTTAARQIRVTKVEPKSPADGTLLVGDVILGVAGKPFAYDPRTEFGKALTESEKNGSLSLIRWRDGKSDTITLKLPVLGSYSATAPFDCPKSKLILEQGCKAIAARITAGTGPREPITRCLNALALLASGNSEYLPLVRKEAEWASGFSANDMQTWRYGYVIMLLSEYTMATGDQSVMPGLKRLALEAANGQSAVGSWGHRFARPDGRLFGYGMMNAPGLPLTTSLILAREAGLKDPALDLAIERSNRLLSFYIGKGAIPYGDHVPWIQNHEDNGKCGIASLMFNQLNNTAGAEYFSRMSLASHGPERDTGHTGNFFNILWALPSVAQSGPYATGAWMQEFGTWYFDLARRWDGSFLHQGPPGLKPDTYNQWDTTGAILLGYAMPLKKIRLTGKNPCLVPQLDAAAAQAIIVDGRGWSNADRTSFYAKFSTKELIERLSSWSIVVRERAAMELVSRKDDSIPELVKMLAAPDLNSRYGACQALAQLKGRAAPAIPALTINLKHDDLWLRIKAAEALAAIGAPAMSTVPQLLSMLAEVDAKKDPRGMQQRYLCFALFDTRDGMLGRSLASVDRTLLDKAIQAGLKNEDGRARSSVGSVYSKLTYEEVKPLLPAILDAIKNPAPSGEMFADGIRMEGLKVLAQHHIKEGILACVDYTTTQNPWASQKRTPELMKILLEYGAQAKPVIPELQKIAASFEKGEPDFPKALSLEKAKAVHETIQAIETSTVSPELISITK